MYSTIVIIFDTVDAVAAVLGWPQPFDKNLEDRVRITYHSLPRLALSSGLKRPVESDQWDNAEILKRFDDSEVISTRGDTVGKIGNDTFVKAAWNFPHLEASAIDFVQMRTTIPIPRVRRRFKDKYGYSIIVMDYIPGERLDHVWPSLSLWSKLWVALTLRRYIRQLRQINYSVPGPLADSPETCDGGLFPRPYGPFPDYASLSAFFNRKLDITKDITYRDDQGNEIPYADLDTEPFDDSRPLVFVHRDLCMRNIILGKDGRIWLVDWSLSGFYPWWFEYVSMVYAAERSRAPDSWNRLVPFIGDPLFKHMRWIDRIGHALLSYT